MLLFLRSPHTHGHSWATYDSWGPTCRAKKMNKKRRFFFLSFFYETKIEGEGGVETWREMPEQINVTERFFSRDRSFWPLHGVHAPRRTERNLYRNATDRQELQQLPKYVRLIEPKGHFMNEPNQAKYVILARIGRCTELIKLLYNAINRHNLQCLIKSIRT